MHAAVFLGSLAPCFEHWASAACFTSDSSHDRKKTLSLSSRISRGSRPDRWAAPGSAAGFGSAAALGSGAGAGAAFASLPCFAPEALFSEVPDGDSAGGVAPPPQAATVSDKDN